MSIQVTAVSSQSANSSCSVEDSVEVHLCLLHHHPSIANSIGVMFCSGAQRDPLQQVEDVGASFDVAQHLRLRYGIHHVAGAGITSLSASHNVHSHYHRNIFDPFGGES